MTEPEPSAVPAPFDSLAGADAPVAEAPARPAFLRGLGAKAGLLALFVVCAGVGQGIAVSLFFGGRDAGLSEESAVPATAAAPVHGEGVPPSGLAHAGHLPAVPAQAPIVIQVPPPAPPAARPPHALEIARERFDHGDVEGARGLAAAWLLRQDGLSAEEAQRAPEAYAVLADVLRRDFERALEDGGAR